MSPLIFQRLKQEYHLNPGTSLEILIQGREQKTELKLLLWEVMRKFSYECILLSDPVTPVSPGSKTATVETWASGSSCSSPRSRKVEVTL